MFHCPNCGTELQDGAAFCNNCGAAQVRSAEPQISTQPAYQPPVYQQPAYQQTSYPTNPPAPAQLPTAAKILGLISMICGLVSLVSCMGGWGPGIAAIILSNIAYNKAPGVPNSKARIGKTTGIIGTILGAICFVIYLIYCAMLGYSIGSSGYYY